MSEDITARLQVMLNQDILDRDRRIVELEADVERTKDVYFRNGARHAQEQAVKLEAEVGKLKVKLNSFQQAMFEAGFMAAKLEATIAELKNEIAGIRALVPDIDDPESGNHGQTLIERLRDAVETEANYDKALDQWGRSCVRMATEAGLPQYKIDGQGRGYYESVLGMMEDTAKLINDLRAKLAAAEVEARR